MTITRIQTLVKFSFALMAPLALISCTHWNPLASDPTLRISVLAFNDLHGNLEPPLLSIREQVNQVATTVPAGGIAYMASAIQQLKAQNPLHAVVSAGDMIGATPLISALFLDEPTIEAVNAIGIDFNAVGNHEFDKGVAELERMRQGGCEQFTRLKPCLVNTAFPGANFEFLAANVKKENGHTLFPAYGIKVFKQGRHEVKVGFVGMTLKGTPLIVTPAGVKGVQFESEAQTANALVPILKAQGVSALVLVIHEGATVQGGPNDPHCPGLAGDIIPILNQLDPAFDVVVSGHTHRAYACDYQKFNPAKPFLLTSAGQYGTLLTHIELEVDALQRKVTRKSAHNLIIQSEAFTNAAGVRVVPTTQLPQFTPHPEVARIVATYKAASAEQAARQITRLPQSITRAGTPSGETALGNLIADAQWAATAPAEKGAADFALMNPGGVRADLIVAPGGGAVNYGQLFSIQPFGNTLTVKTFTGQLVKELLESQYRQDRPRVLYPSAQLTYQVDLKQPIG
ncbi:bifunctional metallophosphatase/5'-nucleotidase, partial [Limnohabitans sp. Rim8]|uniref:bifunctional metallophosphatase/5'-nucleotidase n=1 Tax=Limnohabitans sp. Rim8 TaxID=1100718 RepID=UPI0033066499